MSTLQAHKTGGYRVDAEGAAGGQLIPMSVSENQRGELLETPYARQLTGGGGKPGQGYATVREAAGVRRLTPVECERLMSWPVILEIQGGSYEHIRGAIQSCCEEADAAVSTRRALQPLWEYAGEAGATSPGHHGSTGRGDRAVREVPYGTSSTASPAGGMHRVWCHLSTEAAQAVAGLFAGVPEGVFAPIGEPSLGCFARVTGWTAIDGADTPDSRRYAACGDGVVSNVAEWIARGILREDAA